MFGVVREYEVRPGKRSEIVERIRTEFVATIDKAPGFVGYTVAAVGANGLVTTSTFETRAQADESVGMAARWVAESVSSFVVGSPRVTSGELVVRRVAENGKAGYGVMRRFIAKPTDADESVRRVREGLVPLLSGMPGFVSYGLLMEDGGDRGVTLSAYADRATAEAAGARALEWVKENLAGTEIVEVIAGEIALRHLK